MSCGYTFALKDNCVFINHGFVAEGERVGVILRVLNETHHYSEQSVRLRKCLEGNFVLSHELLAQLFRIHAKSKIVVGPLCFRMYIAFHSLLRI